MNLPLRTYYLGLMTFLLLIFYFLLPFERIPTFEVAGFTVKFSYIVSIVLILYFLAKKPLKVFKEKPLLTSDKFLVLFWVIGALTLFRAENFVRSVIIALLWLFVMLIYLILSRIIENQKTRDKIENVIIWSAILTSIFGIYQFVGDSLGLSTSLTGLRFWYTKEIVDLGFPRIQSVALEPLYYSNFLLVPLFLAIKKYLTPRHPNFDSVILNPFGKLRTGSVKNLKTPQDPSLRSLQRRTGRMTTNILGNKYFWIVVLILINIILGISRGAYLGLVVSLMLLLVFIVIRWKAYNKLKLNILGLGLAVLISIFISYAGVVWLNGGVAAANFRSHAVVADSEEGNSVSGRMEGYQEAWSLFKSEPVIGIGIGNFGASRTFEGDSSGTNFETVNNQYLEILTETGVVGLLLFLLFLIFYAKEMYNVYKKSENDRKLGLVLLFLGLLAVFIQYNFFSTLYIIYIWAYLALLKSEIISKNAK